MKTTKDKIDELLGISEDKTLDSILDDMTLEVKEAEQTWDKTSSEIKENLEEVDKQFEVMKQGGNPILAISSMDHSMKELEDLIKMSKDMYRHVYENVISSELIDSELLGSAGKLLESIHINIAEFIALYRDRQKFIEKIKLMIFAQNQKLELMREKHRLTLEIMKAKAAEKETVDAVDTTASISGGLPSTQEEIVKMIQEAERSGKLNLFDFQVKQSEVKTERAEDKKDTEEEPLIPEDENGIPEVEIPQDDTEEKDKNTSEEHSGSKQKE